ncbi:fimbrial protein [Rouxiella sp. Mn2063]|uniref:fimbrial protein n=1 Tax=Rouxiella sp. Mn2063 TaxID=3395262 RepID=UPI003BBD87E5
MKITRKVIASLLTMAMAGINAPLALASSEPVSVTISGKIIANTCTLDSTSVIVPLGSIALRELQTTGKTSSLKSFHLDLKECGDAAKSVNVTVKGIADEQNSQALALTSAGDSAAQGVAIYLLDKDKNIIPVNDAALATYNLVTGNKNTLLFYAQYVATTDNPRAGEAKSSASIYLDYQ